MRTDTDFLLLALEEAQAAAAEEEVPVGAVLVYRDEVLARDHNRIVQNKNPMAHAEMLVLQAAASRHPDPWLLDTTLYVTLEPCTMCAGALVLSRVKRLVYAARDPKAGACGSVFDVVQSQRLNHRLEVTSGMLESEASQLLTAFFQKRRK